MIISGSRFVGTLCKLSMTGGAMRLKGTVRHGTLADISLKTESGQVTSAIQFLHPARGLQAFRFLQLHGENQRRLQTTLHAMRRAGHGEEKGVFAPILGFAQRAVDAVKSKIS